VRFALSLPAPGPVDVAVVDIAGRLIRSLHHTADKAGDLTLSWDGHDERGQPVPPGAYYYRVTTNAGQSVRTMIWLR
jgi:flagellar hook assembly protein FlgD